RRLAHTEHLPQRAGRAEAQGRYLRAPEKRPPLLTYREGASRPREGKENTSSVYLGTRGCSRLARSGHDGQEERRCQVFPRARPAATGWQHSATCGTCSRAISTSASRCAIWPRSLGVCNPYLLRSTS